MKYLQSNYMKFRNRLFTFDEVVKICQHVLDDEKRDWKRETQIGVALTVTNILNAQPFGFGKKRLSEFFRLLFEQAMWINEHPEDLDLVADTVRKIGLKFQYKGKYLELVDVDKNTSNSNKNKKKV